MGNYLNIVYKCCKDDEANKNIPDENNYNFNTDENLYKANNNINNDNNDNNQYNETPNKVKSRAVVKAESESSQNNLEKMTQQGSPINQNQKQSFVKGESNHLIQSDKNLDTNVEGGSVRVSTLENLDGQDKSGNKSTHVHKSIIEEIKEFNLFSGNHNHNHNKDYNDRQEIIETPVEIIKQVGKPLVKKENEDYSCFGIFQIKNKNLSELEKERILAEQKKLVIEKINVNFRLSNLNEKCKKNEYIVEILFSNTMNIDQPDKYFTIGHTQIYQPLENGQVNFSEEYEVNYLFPRTQHVKLVIYSSDNKKSEISVNLANVIFNKLASSSIFVDLIKGSIVDTEIPDKSSKAEKDSLPQLIINYTRTTPDLHRKQTSLQCEFNFFFATIVNVVRKN